MGENGIVPSGKLMALCQAGDESGDGFPKQCQPCESPMFCWVIGGSVGGSPSRSCPPARGWTLGAPRAVYLQPVSLSAYLQDFVGHILLRKPKRSFAATKATSRFRISFTCYASIVSPFRHISLKGNTSWKRQHSCSG